MGKTTKHPLRGLLTAQFLGAFNDNAWRFVVILLAIRGIEAMGFDPAKAELAAQQRTTLAFVVFTLPIVLFSLPAGVLADRLSKRTVILAMKFVEILLMGAGATTLYFFPDRPELLFGTLALMGIQSAFFSPAKYGILPEILPHAKLSMGNGALEMWTFLAIVSAPAAAGYLLVFTDKLSTDGGSTWLAGAALAVLAVGGFVAALGVPRCAPARSEGGLMETTAGAWAAIRGERMLWLTVIGLTFYWMILGLAGQEILVYCKSTLARADDEAMLPLAVFGLGVGAGAMLAGRLSSGKVELGLIPLGAAGLGVLLMAFGLVRPDYAGTLAFMVPIGVFCGSLSVPLNALLQWRSPDDRRGAVIALSNVFTFAGMLVASVAAAGMAATGLSAADAFVAAGLLTLAGTIWAVRLMPEAFLRLLLILLTHTIYRLKVFGRTRVPEKGGALLVPNHVSFADGLFLMASVDRPIRFIVDASYFSHPFLKPFMKALHAIPIGTAEGPKMVLRALRTAGEHLDQGRLVCVFAEGQITRTGTLLPFRRGLERIVKGRNAPIVPVHLDRVWGSIFSYSGGRFLTKRPERFPYPVTVTFGDALAAGTPVHEVRRAVQELSEQAWTHRQKDRRPVHHEIVRKARRGPMRLLFADRQQPRVTRFKALCGAVSLARTLRPEWEGQKHVGILLPPSVGAALVNIGATLAGQTSVNLNYTVGREAMTSAIRQADLQTVVTSRAFLAAAKIELPEEIRCIWIEDVVAGIGPRAKLGSALLAALAPIGVLERACGATKKIQVDDLLTIIFSSGSTGEPKGVMLSHGNVGSNVDAVSQVASAGPNDRLLGILPLFHSFGYMALWFASHRGMATIFHPNPLDTGAIGELVLRYNVRLLIATPTFLQLYLRRCTPSQFGSIRLVLAGAEKLSERLATAFEDHFGIRPLEGYGATECSPAITVSTLDHRAPGFFQPGSRRGFVGQPLPGVAVRVVDRETSEELPPNTSGLILVKGPNVMKGYLKNEELTKEVMRDGWYVTGDIGLLDEDGFLRITDRISRFSKIGGEMVPHGAVEEALQEAAGQDQQVFAVTAVPCEKKGERLSVLHTVAPDELPEILERLDGMGLPNLFLPRLDQFIRVDDLPLLGTGKLDLRAVKRIAMESTSRAGV